MPAYQITAPNGKTYRIEGPEGASQEDVQNAVLAQFPDAAGPQEPQPQPEQKRTWRDILKGTGKEVGRQLGLTARYAVEGATAIPAAFAAPVNRMLGLPDPAQALSRGLTDAGLPQPQGGGERVVGDVSRALVGAGGSMGAGSLLQTAASPVAQGVGNILVSQPAIQAGSAIAGAGASGLTREAGGGPGAQLAAGLGGALAVPAVTAGSQALVRGAIRGGAEGQARMQDNIRTFNETGASPSVGQATGNRRTQAFESYLAKSPGSAGRMTNFATNQADDISKGLEKTAGSLSKGASAEQTGRAIEKGVRGTFTDGFRAKQGDLYAKLDQYIKPDTPVSVSKTQAALAELTKITKGAEATSKRLINPKIAAITSDLSQDAAGGSIPYSALKEIRSRIGQELSDSALVSDAPKAQLKRLYAALSQDMGDAATTAGPQAKQAWMRANNYTKAGMSRLEVLESVVNKNGGPEAIYRAATSGTKEGASTLRAVMQSLPPEGQKQLAATMVRRLGTAKAGVQNEVGDVFSTETFLTNWNTLSNEAKRAAFDRFGPQFSKSMDTVAKAAANLRQGSQVFRNPSGTGQALALGTTVGGAAMAVLTGNIGAAAGIGAYAAANNGAARLMTNPNFVNWLAKSTQTPIVALPGMVNQLAQMGEKTGDPDIIQLAEQLSQAGSAQ